ncbi:hypothetical protein CKQ90_28105, partial [Klebsiella pneumoniae]
VAAATVAQQGLKRVAMRQQVIQAIREAGEKYARELAELAVTETGMGRVEDKFAKTWRRRAARRVPAPFMIWAFLPHWMTLSRRQRWPSRD